MQALLASLVTSLDIKDAAFKAGMAEARAEAQKTGQDFDKSADQMSSAMDRAANDIERAMVRIAQAADDVQRHVRNAGLALTAALTLPLGGLAAASNAAAEDFQTAMNSVHSALLNASPAELDKLRTAALQMGPAVGKSATDAAEGIDNLARAGLSASAILSGGLQSALTLSVVGQTEIANAADATTDILSQFSKTTAELPAIVNKVSGALDVSKLDFDDYKLAIGQTGGIAGNLGVTFDEMNAALAATASYFDSGSDAGTSFKTFLLALKPISADAKRTIEKLGLQFFDANGQAKSLGDVAEELKTKLAGLNDRTLRTALTNIFGADGMRTAIALMKAGRKGIEETQAAIDRVSADQKTAVLLTGEAAAAQRLASAWQNLKIQIGDAGIIQTVTAIKSGIADLLSVLGSAPPWFYQMAVAAGVAAASIGPLILVAGTLAKVILPLLLLRLGPVALVVASIINPVGVLIRLLAQLAIAAGSVALASLATRLLAFAGPIGLAISLLAIFIPLLTRTATASAAMQAATDAAREAQAKATDIATQLAIATGRAKDETLKLAQAQRVQAVQAIQAAKSNMLAARAAYAVAQQQLADADQAGSAAHSTDADGGLGFGAAVIGGSKNVEQTKVDYKAAQEALAGRLEAFNTLDAAIKAAQKPGPKLRDMNFDAPKTGRGGMGRDTSADEADYEAKLAEARNAELDAHADLTGSVEARYRATMSQLTAERADYVHQLQRDQGISSVQADTLLAEKDKELAIRRQIAEQNLSRGLYQQQYDIAKATNDTDQELARSHADLADTAADRRAAELRLLDLQQQQEAADVELVLATKDSSSAEYAAALDRRKRLPEVFADQRRQTMRQTEGPLDSFARDLPSTASKMNEAFQSVAVDGLKNVTDGIADAITGAKSLASVFSNVASSIIADLARIAIQKAIISPIVNAIGGVFGGADLGALSGAATSSVTASLSAQNAVGNASILSAFGGFKKNGGGVNPANWYVVGEEGPEVFAPGTSGTIIPNGGRGATSRQGAVINQTLNVAGGVDLATRTETYRLAEATRQAAISGVQELQRRRA